MCRPSCARCPRWCRSPLWAGKLLLTTVSLKPAVLRLYTKHMQHLPACRGAGMCFGNKPWWGHEVHTRKAKSTMVRKQEEMELPAKHKSRRVAAYASA